MLEFWQTYAVGDSILMLTAILEKDDYEAHRPNVESRLSRFFDSLIFTSTSSSVPWQMLASQPFSPK
jgi:hypothetical protein